MPRKTHYLPKDDAGRAAWLTTFVNILPNYQAALGLTAADIASVQADAACFAYLLRAQTNAVAFAASWTSCKNALRDGAVGDFSQWPALPSVGTAPALVAPGIIGRTTTLVARLKAMPGYTNEIGLALGVIGSEPATDPNQLQPKLTVWQESGRVKVGWTKGALDSLEIWVDRGQGFAYLAINTIPDYTDPAPLPTGGQSAVWKYKGIYRKADQHVGQWSNVTSLAVAG